MFIAALFAIDKIQKQPKCLPTDERIDLVCTYNGVSFSNEERNLPFVTTEIDFEGIMLTEIS